MHTYVNYDIIFPVTLLKYIQLEVFSMKKFDVVDLMSRSYRVPKSGLPIRDPEAIFYPLENVSARIYNCSTDKRFFVFATEYETFICPFFFGIEDLLKENGFLKVDHTIINVNFGPKMCPRYQNALDPWISNFNAIRKYCYETAQNNVNTNISVRGSLLIPSALKDIKRIPNSGVFIPELKKIFYPAISNVFPYIIHSEYIGTYNYKKCEDDSCFTYILYNTEGSYVAKGSGSQFLSNILANRGFGLNANLFIPNFDEI